MPGVNTPQFTWVLSRLPTKAQPVPPFYQPEVAARGVLYAADHPAAPGLLGRHRHRRHHRRQPRRRRAARPLPRPHRDVVAADPEDRPADQPANLWHPLDGEDGRDFGAHGPFDDRAHPRSPQQWSSQHRRELLLAGAGLAAGAALRARRPA